MKEIEDKKLLKRTQLSVLEDGLDMFIVGSYNIKGDLELNNVYYSDTAIVIVLEQFMRTYSIQIPFAFNSDNIKEREIYIDEDLFDEGGYIVVAEKYNPDFSILIKGKNECKEYFDNSLVHTSNGVHIIPPEERKNYVPFNGFAMYHCEIKNAVVISFVYDYSYNKLRNIFICDYINDKSVMFNLIDRKVTFNKGKAHNDTMIINENEKRINIYLDEDLYVEDFEMTDGFGYKIIIEKLENLNKAIFMNRMNIIRKNSTYGIMQR